MYNLYMKLSPCGPISGHIAWFTTDSRASQVKVRLKWSQLKCCFSCYLLRNCVWGTSSSCIGLICPIKIQFSEVWAKCSFSSSCWLHCHCWLQERAGHGLVTLRLPFAGSDQSSFSFVSTDYVISILKHLVDKNYFRREIQSGDTPVEGELKFVDVVEYFVTL